MRIRARWDRRARRAQGEYRARRKRSRSSRPLWNCGRSLFGLFRSLGCRLRNRSAKKNRMPTTNSQTIPWGRESRMRNSRKAGSTKKSRTKSGKERSKKQKRAVRPAVISASLALGESSFQRRESRNGLLPPGLALFVPVSHLLKKPSQNFHRFVPKP